MDSLVSSRLRACLVSGGALLTVAATAVACSSGSTGAAKNSGSSQGGGSAGAIPLQDSYEAVVRAVLPSVVQISAKDSTGSGIVYDDRGDIVTNEHVIGSAKKAEVLLADGSSLDARVIGEFAPDDLAVIRVTKDADQLKVAKFSDSNDTTIGEIVLAMGNPLGLTNSVTQGIISATGRTVSASEPGQGGALITSAIQTSAAINPGNSGGALVNLEDEVVGIPTLAARLPDQGGAAPGIGFAIPSNTVRNIADQLISTGKVTTSDRATLGITAQTAANQKGQDIGVAVVAVANGGPADKAGLRPGDVIVAADGHATTNLQVLESFLATQKPATEVQLTVVRNGATRHVTVKLGSLGS